MYLIEYKFPSSSQTSLIKTYQAKTLIFLFRDKRLEQEKQYIIWSCIRSAEVELQVGVVPCSLNLLAIQFLQSVYFVVQPYCDPKWAFPVGTKLSRSGIFFEIASNMPHKVVELKNSWLNLCIVSPHFLELGSFFLDPGHFLDFICCLQFYPSVFFILMLLEQQSPYQWFPDFNGNHGICVICESVRSFIGRCLW